MVFTFETEAERDKLTFIWARYKNLMLHKAYAILRDYSLAEDAVSEAMLRIYKNLHKIEEPISNRGVAFIVTVVKNAALTLLEKERRNPIELEPFEETLEDERDLEGIVLAKLGAERIRAMIAEARGNFNEGGVRPWKIRATTRSSASWRGATPKRTARSCDGRRRS
jgi:RNA polymerase sigma-70 factor (ECF subfamily)